MKRFNVVHWEELHISIQVFNQCACEWEKVSRWFLINSKREIYI